MQHYDQEEAMSRTRRVLGEEGLEKLKQKRMIVFGVGGVGGYVVEALARSGVGHLDLVDSDRVSMSNLNRQIFATLDTVGQEKTRAAKERIQRINPECRVTCWPVFFLPEQSGIFPWTAYDYIIDAIDTVTSKIELAVIAQKYNIPIISSMGTGNKLDPSALELTDLYRTTVCPLAKVMRHECRKRGIRQLKVVYSKEIPISDGKRIPGSTAFVPPAAGLLIASAVVRDLITQVN